MRKRDLGFLFAVFGLTLFIETIVYIFLRGYEYFPLLIPNSPENDGVIGNIISQLSISTVALFLCVFKIPFRGAVFGGAAFFLIEELFLTLGIYKHYWYKSWITFVGLIVLFEVIKKWHKLIFNTSSPVIRYFTTMLGVLALYLPTTNWIGILSGYFQIKKDILIDPFISHAIIAMPKYLILINMVYLLIVKKASWIWNLAVILLVFSSDMILYYTKLMYIKDGWLPIYSGISLFTAYLYIHTMNKLLYGDRSYRS